MRFVITAGPTREPIDPVRYLSNRSSGKMGYAIAEAAITAGHDVVLVSGPVTLAPPAGASVFHVTTADEMFAAVRDHVVDCDVLVMAAAVADYKPAKVSQRKIKKQTGTVSLPLVLNRDILATIAGAPHDSLIVGFAAETNDVEENARKKLTEKNVDIVVANDVSDPALGLESDENALTILFRDGRIQKFSRAPKKILARELVKIFAKTREKCLTKKMW